MAKLGKVVVGFVLFAAFVGVALVTGMRRKSPVVLNMARQASRATRPLALRTAGARGSPVSVVRHVGRTSGRPYETPVVAARADDGFVIALPYGRGTDWLRNVLASGTATILSDGQAYDVDRPEVIQIDTGTTYFRGREQRLHRQFHVSDCLRVRDVNTAGTGQDMSRTSEPAAT